MRLGLIPRWDVVSGVISSVIRTLKRVVPDIKPNGRGQPPKHPIKEYIILGVLKEAKHAPLRGAETDFSELVCGERVDHSVIHYWEKHIDPRLLEWIVQIFGRELDKQVGYLFSIVDGTLFADWHHRTIAFHYMTRVAQGTVYPVNITPDTLDPLPNIRQVMVPGGGFAMMDRWYDVNTVFRHAYRMGYTPLIKPQRTRYKGYWRKKGRCVYERKYRYYRQRGRGESPFGSLTNWLGDRLDTSLHCTAYVRCCLRTLAYQTKILIRAEAAQVVVVLVLVRHARGSGEAGHKNRFRVLEERNSRR